MPAEAGVSADFSRIRYAQSWEDADILLEALNIQPGHVCLSIASAGDNALAMLSRGPQRVIALDLNPAQLACLELRVAGYRELSHAELLELIGSQPSARRADLYARCRSLLSVEVRNFWDNLPQEIEQGIGGAGKFERYFKLFRTRVLPLVHSRRRIAHLLRPTTRQQRERFYRVAWDSWRWRWMFRIFFSRLLMGRLGRDPSFFKYVQGSVAERILQRTRHALTELAPSENPYLQWILTGHHPRALPHALRPENFENIRANLDYLEWHCVSLEDFLNSTKPNSIDCFNLSDIFEYMSEANYHKLLDGILSAGRSGGRLAYWNMLAPRSRPDSMAEQLRPLSELARQLHNKDKAFFYSNFVVEEII